MATHSTKEPGGLGSKRIRHDLETKQQHKQYKKEAHKTLKYLQTMAPDSGTLAWKIPWTEQPGRLQSMGSLGVAHD